MPFLKNLFGSKSKPRQQKKPGKKEARLNQDICPYCQVKLEKKITYLNGK